MEKKVKYPLKRKKMKKMKIENWTVKFAKFENNNSEIFTFFWGKVVFTKQQ